jgi:MFS family permease
LNEPLIGQLAEQVREPVPAGDALLQNQAVLAKDVSFWRAPGPWIGKRNLSRGYWTFFSAAFFFDAGFAVYVFLFNLYLLDLGFNERAMGWIGGAFTLGAVVGTLPSGQIAHKFGVRPLMVALFISAPLLSAVRAEWMWEPAQIGLGFLAGLAMSGWGVCFLPIVARTTTQSNRTAGFSLIFSVSIGTSMVGGIVCGYLRQWLAHAGIALGPAEVKRLILLLSCAVVLVGLIPALRLHVPEPPEDAEGAKKVGTLWRQWKLSPFMARFLPPMALWAGVLAAFTPFAVVYLEHDLRVSMSSVGLIFTAVQLVQFFMGLATPYLFRKLGLMNGILVTQLAAAMTLGLLAAAHGQALAIALYMTFSAAQWASAPGLYNLLMDCLPDADRSTGAAMTMFTNALCGAGATALAGALFTRFGYPPVLLGLAVAATGVAMLFRFLTPAKAASLRSTPAERMTI